MSQGFIKVTNLERYQHYRDRRPTWVKLYQSILDDYEYCELPDASKAHFVGMILLASRLDNRIPADAGWIAQRIGASEPVDLAVLIASGLVREWGDEAVIPLKADWPSRYVPEKLRAAIFERDGHRCKKCGAVDRLELDHILPVSQGGTGQESNLRVLCTSCNRQPRSNVYADA